MYLVLAKFSGKWVVSQIEHKTEALQAYHNQASKVSIWASEAMLVEGTVLKSVTEKEALKARGYPLQSLTTDKVGK